MCVREYSISYHWTFHVISVDLFTLRIIRMNCVSFLNGFLFFTSYVQDLQTALQSSVNTHLSSLVNLSQTALSLILLRVPDSWNECVGPSAPPSSLWGLQEWLNDIAQRYVFMDKVLVWGIERTPTYWLGAFFNPQRLLSTVLQQVTCYLL